MKKYLHKIMFIIMIPFSHIVYSQNIVPNCSFEDTVSCQQSNEGIDQAEGWSSYGSSPDYYNTCSPDWDIWHVPNNYLGFQYPATGNAYAGLIPYDIIPNGNYANQEFIGRELSQQLIIGQKYYVSFKINLPKKDTAAFNTSDAIHFACNKIGVLFSNVSYSEFDPPVNLIKNFAHFYTDSIVLDTLDWVTISGWFTADSAYRYIIIGNFFDHANTDTIRIFKTQNDSLWEVFAYYFIDDVCVSLDSTNCNCLTGNSINSHQSQSPISIHYTSEGIYVTINDSETNSFTMSLYDMLGREIKRIGSIYERKIKIEKGDLPNGIYLLNINNSKINFNQKMLLNN